jgi:hypothetical protein
MLSNQISNLARNESDLPQAGLSDVRSVTVTIEEAGWLITAHTPCLARQLSVSGLAQAPTSDLHYDRLLDGQR